MGVHAVAGMTAIINGPSFLASPCNRMVYLGCSGIPADELSGRPTYAGALILMTWWCAVAERVGALAEQTGSLRSKLTLLVDSVADRE